MLPNVELENFEPSGKVKTINGIPTADVTASADPLQTITDAAEDGAHGFRKTQGV